MTSLKALLSNTDLLTLPTETIFKLLFFPIWGQLQNSAGSQAKVMGITYLWTCSVVFHLGVTGIFCQSCPKISNHGARRRAIMELEDVSCCALTRLGRLASEITANGGQGISRPRAAERVLCILLKHLLHNRWQRKPWFWLSVQGRAKIEPWLEFAF